MRHSHQDAIDTAARRAAGTRGEWHPLQAAVETDPGLWYMVDARDECYGIIRFLTVGADRGYRAVTWARRSEERRLIGYYTSLRAAAEAVHRRFLSEHGHVTALPPPSPPVHRQAQGTPATRVPPSSSTRGNSATRPR